MSFTNTDPQSHSSENTWFTPKEFIDALGPFDLDPCTVSYRPFDTAKNHIEHDKGFNSLEMEWSGDVWLNPPYGKEIMPFIEKFSKHKHGVMLIFARMGSKGVQHLIRTGATFYFLRKRIKFIQKDLTEDTNAGTDSALVFYQDKYMYRAVNFEGQLMRMAHLC